MANLSMEELAAQYGYAAEFFGSDPELKALIKAAVAGQWSTQKFQAKFMNTTWYRTREASVRQWMDLATRDPAEAKSKINDRKLEFANMLSQFGAAPMSDTDLTFIATNSLREGWSQAETKRMLTYFAGYQPGNANGTAATLEMQVKGMANDYGVTVTTGQLTDWVTGMMSERYTEDNLRDYLRDMAKSKYAGMGTYLDMGMTVKQVAAPYLSSYSQLMEVGADSVDLSDNVIQQALQGTPPAPNQPPQMQSLYQFEQTLRRDPRWLRTKNARESVTSAGQNILRDWGLVG